MVRPNSGLLAAMLRGSLLTGALRWKVTFTSESIVQEAAMAGWKSVWIDLSGLKKLDQVNGELARVLSFPDYFDGELGSIAGFLVDSVPGDSGLLIGVSGWQEFVKASPADAKAFADALDSAIEGQSVVAIFCDPSGNYPGLAELSLA